MMHYNKYKPSGVEWLGNIPNHWVIKRVKDTSITKSGTTPLSGNKKYYENGTFNWVRTTDLNDGELYEVEYKVTQLALDECRLAFLPIDTILVAMYGGLGTIGKNSILKKSSTINQSVCAILPSRKLSSIYFMYFLKYFRTDWMLFADGARKDPNINQDAVKNLFILYPPLAEQTTIAQYLDTKSQAIDKKVNLLSKKADFYKELRKSIINDAVCKGLDKNVKLKESGIEWIGKIPQHWQITRVKDSFNLFTGNSISDKGLFERKENSIDYVSTKDIDFETGRITYENGVYIPIEDKSFKIAKANSVLICIEGANAGKKIGFTSKDICFVNKLCAIKSRSKNNIDKYFFYYTQSPLFEKQFFSILNGLIGGVSLNSIKYFDIISPTKEEQIAIANYLDEKTQKIDAIVANIGKQIETLKELRKTLINDVITGKIKVMA